MEDSAKQIAELQAALAAVEARATTQTEECARMVEEAGKAREMHTVLREEIERLHGANLKPPPDEQSREEAQGIYV